MTWACRAVSADALGDGAMLTRLPKVSCPNCKTFMMPAEIKPVLFTKGLQEVTYACEPCGTTIVQTIKPAADE